MRRNFRTKRSGGLVALCLLFPLIAAAQQSTVALTLFPERSPEKDRTVRVVAQLAAEGKPLIADSLKTVGEDKLLLHMVDAATLTDYQQLHPQPTATPGSYLFSFTSQSQTGYCVWADITPLGGERQFIPAFLGSPVKVSIEAEAPREVTLGQYRFHPFFKAPAVAGSDFSGTIEVMDNEGKPAALAPLADITGFYLNCAGMIQAQAKSEAPGLLQFQLRLEKAGYLRLFFKIAVGGETIWVPFAITVLSP